MMWLFITRRTDLLPGGVRVLHFAPERQLERLLRRLDIEYVTADLLRKDVDKKLDVTSIDEPDRSFDVVICSHVLEHVPDDKLAMRELRRITKPSGWAFLIAPVRDDLEDTFEDWTVTTPAERARVFGQFDHVRYYGRNYSALLAEQGWEVDVTPMPLSDDESSRFGIPPVEQRIYLSRPRH